MTKKYEFTGETKEHAGLVLRRIRRLGDGLIGGWIEKESNLSHKGDCFVYDNAQVSGDACVFGNAQVASNATVYDNAQVASNAVVSDNTRVHGNAQVYGSAHVYGNANISGNANIYDNAQVYGDAHVASNALVSKTPICISGYKHHITITETHIFIGCKGHTIEHWKKNIKAIGLANHYSEGEISIVILLLKAGIKATKE